MHYKLLFILFFLSSYLSFAAHGQDEAPAAPPAAPPATTADQEPPQEIPNFTPPTGAGEPPQIEMSPPTAEAKITEPKAIPIPAPEEAPKEELNTEETASETTTQEENTEAKIEVKPETLPTDNMTENTETVEEVTIQEATKKKPLIFKAKRKKRWEELAEESEIKSTETSPITEAVSVESAPPIPEGNTPYTPPSARDLIPEETKGLTLGSAIEQGLRENSDQKVRSWKSQLLELNYNDNRDKFWLPQTALVLQTDNQRMGRLWSDHDQKNSHSDTVPTGKFGLEMQDYTVFNWGKDYLAYLNTKGQIRRQKENLEESRLFLKHQIIDTYFKLVKFKTLEFINREQVRQSSFIYRIDKEKASLGQTGRQNYFQSRGQYLLEQQEYNMSRIETHDSDKEMALLLGDDANTTYAPSQTLKYQELILPLNQALEMALAKNANVADKKEALIAAKRNREIADKENLPLPKFSINLGSYTSTFSANNSATKFSTDERGPGGRNIELKAVINMTWSLTGEGGFFNSRQKARAFYMQSIAEEEYNFSTQLVKNQVRQYYNKIIEYEKQMEILIPMVSNARKQYDETLASYMRKQSSFLQLKDALTNLKYSEVNYENLKYDHMNSKIKLAQILGIDDLPGESFEKLIIQKDKE